MAYAEISDIEARLGRELDESESQIVGTRLGDVEILIRSRISDLDGKVTSGKILEGAVVLVEAEALLRLIRNPEGYTTETDGNYAYTIDAAVSSGRLQILDAEWALLGIRRGAFSLRPVVDVPWGCGREGHPLDMWGPRPPTNNEHEEDHPATWWSD